MEDTDLRAAFHAAYDATVPPTPWLASSVRGELVRRRATSRAGMRPLSLAWTISILAVALIATLVAVAVIANLWRQLEPIPGRSGIDCPGSGAPLYLGPPAASDVPIPTTLPLLPSHAAHICSSEETTTDSVAKVAAFYEARIVAAGLNATYGGPWPGFVITRWVRDPAVINGPQPGYRPELTGLTGDDVASATSRLDANGTSWIVDIKFTARGSALLADLTRANVAACPTGSCAERHLTFWIGLMQPDIDQWHDSANVAAVSQQFDGGPSVASSKLLADPITLEPITGGELAIAQSDGAMADYLAASFNLHLLGEHYQIRFVGATGGSPYGTIDLVTDGETTVIWTRVSQ